MNDVFLSYAGPDKPLALSLRQALQDQGLRVFMDVDMAPGALWDEELPRALFQSRCMVALVTHLSQGGYYNKEEIALARDLSRPMIAIMVGRDISGCDVPFGLHQVPTYTSLPHMWDDVSASIRQRVRDHNSV